MGAITLIMSFYMYLASNDSDRLYDGNKFHDFIVETPHEYVFKQEHNWLVALTDLSLEGSSTGRTETLVKSIIVLCDLANRSYISQKTLPVLRYIPAAEDSSASLFQSYYVGLSKIKTNKIRITLLDKNLLPLKESEWGSDLVLRCTLHFVRND